MERISIAGAAVFVGGRVRCTLNVPTACIAQSESIVAGFLEAFRSVGSFCEEVPWQKGLDFGLNTDLQHEHGRSTIARFNQYFSPYLVTGPDVDIDLDYGVLTGNGSRLMVGSRFVAP
ncbi:MAG: hypothetical protein V4467_04670 [Patescibacteria group bacterium]